jgi:hypothetical protein
MSEETIPQMRDQIDTLNKANKDLTADVDRLTGENRGFAARDAFRNEGYAANHGDLYAAANPEGDITADGVNEFAGQFNLPKLELEVSTEGDEGSTEEGDQSLDGGAGSTDLADMARGGSRPGESAGGASPESMTRAEWQVLMQSDPAAGQEAVRQGKVQISRDNPWGDGQPVTPGSNPYNPSST